MMLRAALGFFTRLPIGSAPLPTTGNQTATPRNVGGSGAEPMGRRVKKPRAARSIISCLCLAACSFP